MNIFLFRHGQTEWNLEGRFQGQLDSPLTPKGRVQARNNAHKVIEHMGDIESIKIFASPLGRAKSTAHIVCDELGISRERIKFDNRIMEFNYGVFEGKRKQDLIDTEAFKAREENKWFYKIEGGDSYEIVAQRVQSFLNSIAQEKEVMIIAHEMVNRTLRGLYFNLPKEKILNFRQPNDVVLFFKGNREFLLT